MYLIDVHSTLNQRKLHAFDNISCYYIIQKQRQAG